jgi:hypothetical protein
MVEVFGCLGLAVWLSFAAPGCRLQDLRGSGIASAVVTWMRPRPGFPQVHFGS